MLVIMQHKLSDTIYENFKAQHHTASVHLKGCNKAMAAVVAETLEQGPIA